MLTGESTIRVRYSETHPPGFLHPSNYLVYFEQGRTDLARTRGIDYRSLEDQGYLLVVIRAEVRFHHPAHYDDLLTLRTTLVRTTNVKMEHRYELYLNEKLLAEGATTLACVDRSGQAQRMPDFLRDA